MASYGAVDDAHNATGASNHTVIVADKSAEQQPLVLTANRGLIYLSGALAISTPHWMTYDAVFFDVESPEDVPATHRERAHTSPIWYTLVDDDCIAVGGGAFTGFGRSGRGRLLANAIHGFILFR